MEYKIYDSAKELAQAVAVEYIELLKLNKSANLGLATGGTPLPLYEELIKQYEAGNISFKDASAFNLDEYIGLAPKHKKSYRYFMNNIFYSKIDINIENTYIPSGLGDSNKTAKDYEKLILANPIDLQLLGIGANGHIAFNEPGIPLDSITQVVELTNSTIENNKIYFDDISEVPTQAITMGIKTIKRAKKIILIATGANKAAAIYEMFNGIANNENCPASALQDHGNVVVYLDKEAAKRL